MPLALKSPLPAVHFPAQAQPTHAQPRPAQPSPAQPSPAQPSPAQPSPAQFSRAQPSPTKPSPAPSPATTSALAAAPPSPARPASLARPQPSPTQPSPALSQARAQEDAIYHWRLKILWPRRPLGTRRLRGAADGVYHWLLKMLGRGGLCGRSGSGRGPQTQYTTGAGNVFAVSSVDLLLRAEGRGKGEEKRSRRLLDCLANRNLRPCVVAPGRKP